MKILLKQKNKIQHYCFLSLLLLAVQVGPLSRVITASVVI